MAGHNPTTRPPAPDKEVTDMKKANAARSQAAFDRALGRALERVAELRAAGKTGKAGRLYREISHALAMCDAMTEHREPSL